MSEFVFVRFAFPLTQAKKEGEVVCKILKEIDGLSPKKLLRKYDVSFVPPVNLKALVERIGIFSSKFDFSEAEQEVGYNKGDIRGAVLSDEKELMILYADTLSDKEARMTIAHELAHCCLHAKDLEIDHLELNTATVESEVDHEKEKAANDFAEDLLVPLDLLKYICELLVKPTVSALSDLFQVPPEVIQNRSKDLLSCKVFDDISPQNESVVEEA